MQAVQNWIILSEFITPLSTLRCETNKDRLLASQCTQRTPNESQGVA